ncbi:hypothetical protein [Tropicibacter naphthalenivorans]|uniref:Uncharacterized protein n=1 Tax=Tropicibacter naphthalenivorans TaxID=441103 RepID=A0A0P1GJY9_9RHOB|nr:hypothetical protein [Tropicibacter naphthalenivorans]CUH82463.1 hypothetical protein TRN7648_04004 [Tropicibacter naphthalenivorans]SMD07406.1 hypothetical protein SAMN04488093_11557 [Tropicibacter naphthalenivorans]
MLPTTFRIAMLNRITLAPYYTPSVPDASGYEWLIVERAGPVLSISDGTVSADGTETKAPDDLNTNNTLASVLIEPGSEIETFLFMRHLPPPAVTEGAFFPADGYARLARSQGGDLTLSAHGRHALLTEIRAGRPVHLDVSIPPANFGGARTWHFEAAQKPWTQQVI